MKKILALVLALSMVFALCACGSSSTTTAATTATEAPAAEATEAPAAETEAPAESDLPYYVRDPSTVTGTITVYTTMEETQQEVLIDLWNKYYPDCDIEIQADSVGTLATKIRGDEQCDADVVIGGMFAADGEAYHDILQPYTAACDAEQNFHDDSGYYTFYDVQVMCLIVNTALEQELGVEINGYEDLINPALEGKIILAAPDASSSGWRQLQTILATMGESFDDDQGWAYIEQLMPLAFSSTSSKDVYNLVINGEYAVGLSYESTCAALINDGAQDVKIVYMEEGNTAMAGGAAIVKNAPNLEAAQAMMDLLSSAEFQDARAAVSAGRGSNSNCDLSVCGLPAEDTLGLVDLDYTYLANNKEQMIEHWNDLWAQTH